ncbi:MAG: OmpA family protein [Thermodesulfobacteriota bacterium]
MASRRRDPSGKPRSVFPDTWMVTFGDLIMLMLTFFVMLMTMKSMDNETARKLLTDLAARSGPPGIQKPGTGRAADTGFGQEGRPVFIEDGEGLRAVARMLEGIQTRTAEQEQVRDLMKKIDVAEDDRGVVITLESDELFASGGADIRPDRMTLLDAMGKIIRKAANDIVIVGHTDAMPIQSDNIRSNWELSVFRAVNVYYYLTDHAGVPGNRLAPGGLGDQMPRFANDSPENMAKNRRIEFVLKQTEIMETDAGYGGKTASEEER